MINIIYIIKNRINSKIYVGQTWDTLEYRWRSGHGYAKCTHLQHAITKYGKNNFYYEILTVCSTQEVADYWESYFIQRFDSVKNGYNLLTGRSNGKHSEETKRKISVAKLGTIASEEARKNMSKAQTGRKHSLQTKEKMSKIKFGKKPYEMTDKIRQTFSELNKGEGNPFFGKHHSNETKQKLSNANKDKRRSPKTEFKPKITYEIAEQIRIDRKNGVTCKDIAIKYGVSGSVVSDVTLNKRWVKE